MGLDVYLKKYENFSDAKKREDEYQKLSSKNWDNGKKYEDLTQEEKEDLRSKDQEIAKNLGLDKYGRVPETESKNIEMNHEKYPDHYFKIGYFRSSYNNEGIEHVLENLQVGGLYEIFERKRDDEYEFQPKWEEALRRVEKSISDLNDIIKNENNYYCFKVSYNEFSGNPNDNQIDSEQKAMKSFLEVKEKHVNIQSENFSNSVGEFFFKEPLQVIALIQGVNKRFFVNEKLPCTYVVCKHENLNWYLQALEIVRDTILYVLSQPDVEKYYLCWSA